MIGDRPMRSAANASTKQQLKLAAKSAPGPRRRDTPASPRGASQAPSDSAPTRKSAALATTTMMAIADVARPAAAPLTTACAMARIDEPEDVVDDGGAEDGAPGGGVALAEIGEHARADADAGGGDGGAEEERARGVVTDGDGGAEAERGGRGDADDGDRERAHADAQHLRNRRGQADLEQEDDEPEPRQRVDVAVAR